MAFSLSSLQQRRPEAAASAETSSHGSGPIKANARA